MNDLQRMMEILTENGLADWTINIDPKSQAYCWISQKKITLQIEDCFGLFLHELAHALAPEPEPLGKGQHFHGGHWADKFTDLVIRYMAEK